jgi:hypothetical protein
MRKMASYGLSFGLVIILLCGASPATAGKPQQGGIYIGNGYPSGRHHNLNIHGKKSDFECPAPQYIVTEDLNSLDGIVVGDVVDVCPSVDYHCEQVFGNVINLPRDGSHAQILVESGRKGPKSNPDVSTLEVTDWCTKPFDNDAAVFRLPANKDGYVVYGRVTGKPVDGQYFEVFGRTLSRVELECVATDPDCPESGVYDLIILGVVTEDGVFVPVGGMDSEDFQRVDNNDGRGGKGTKNATDVTSMFEFTGSVCYMYAEDPACTSGTTCAATDYCCPTDPVTLDYNGECVLLSDPKFLDVDTANQDCSVANDAEAVWVDEILYCRDYTDKWIFNIADFVDVLFDVKNNESYNIKLRFYPLPLNAN